MGKDGKPVDGNGRSLTKSTYNPPHSVVELFSRVQKDYQKAHNLQHRPFDEFDGVSLLQRAKLDQQTFSAYVGAQYVPEHKRWRWRGRKNTARNKLIGILAHMLSGMLYPLVRAQDEQAQEDKTSAQVMRLLVEEHLRKAGYQTKFLYIVLSALVNPAVIVKVEYVEAVQRIKQRLADGTVKVREAIDTLLCGLNLNILPIDQVLLGDFFVNDVQFQPYIIEIERMTYEKARKIWGSSPNFQYVQSGQTRVVIAGNESATLFDIDWTEADQTAVQVITAYYRDEDLQVTFVGGVFVGDENDIYNANPFEHRRMSLLEDEWVSIPVYPFAKTFFEPLDPAGRFAYGKSGAFKEYWDDATQNKMHQLLVDGTYLDVIKPIFFSGVARVDSTVIAPGATVGMPQGAQANPYQLGPNLVGAMSTLQKQEQDMSESTQDKIQSGVTTPGVTATQSLQAQQQAQRILGVFGNMIADLITKVGELVIDCEVQHTTIGTLDATSPDALKMKYHAIMVKSSEGGKDMSNRIVFNADLIGKKMTGEEQEAYGWKLWEDAGGAKAEYRIYHVNPYRFARIKYSMFVDPEQITASAIGSTRMKKMLNVQMLTSQFVYPFTDQKEVADYVIEEFSDGDPDRFKNKQSANDMMSAVMGMGQEGPTPSPIQPEAGAGSKTGSSMNQLPVLGQGA